MIDTLLKPDNLLYFGGVSLMIIVGSIAIIIGAINSFKKKSPAYFKLFIIYIGCSIFQGFMSFYYEIYTTPINMDAISANIFTLLEFVVFNTFFLSVLQSKLIKHTLTVLFFAFPTFCVFYWSEISSFYIFPYTVSVIEAFCFLLPCAFYFYEVFTKPPIDNLANQAPFWITTGMFFYFITIIPSFLIMKFFEKNWHLFKNLALIGFFSTSLLYLLMIKAFLCRSKLTV